MSPRAALARAASAGVFFAVFAAARAADAPATAYTQGATTFQANCAVCHGPAGAGVPSLAPPLVSYPAHYAVSTEGRRQLVMTVLYGLFGDIVVEDKHYDFRMPDFARLDDAALATTLNFIVFDLGHAPASVKPMEPAEIAAERAHVVDGAAVREHRKSISP
jgi:mono/diheme cytochrome c family protein